MSKHFIRPVFRPLSAITDLLLSMWLTGGYLTSSSSYNSAERLDSKQYRTTSWVCTRETQGTMYHRSMHTGATWQIRLHILHEAQMLLWNNANRILK